MSETMPEEIQTIFSWEDFKLYGDAELTARWFAAWTRLNGDFLKIGSNELYASVTSACKMEYIEFRKSLAERTNSGEKLPLCIPTAMESYAKRRIHPEDLAPIPDGGKRIPIFCTEGRVPLIVGGMPCLGIQSFEGKGLDVKFRFKNLRGVKIDAFLYDLGRKDIPKDISSPELEALLVQTSEAMIQTNIGIGYEEYALAIKSTIDSPINKDTLYLWIAIRFRGKNLPTQYPAQMISHLALRTDGGYFNKVRCSYAEMNSELDNILFGDFYSFVDHWHSLIQKVGNPPL